VPVELTILVCCGLLSLSLALTTIAVHGRRFGGATIRSNREGYPKLDGVAGRVVRAHANLNEALVPFGLIILALVMAHGASGRSALAAATFLGARIAHASFYIAGIVVLRSIAFYVGLVATIVLATQVLQG
jgi:uncharacterized MAPEG superfamily protein